MTINEAEYSCLLKVALINIATADSIYPSIRRLLHRVDIKNNTAHKPRHSTAKNYTGATIRYRQCQFLLC